MRDFKGLLKIADDQLGAITEYAIPSVYDKDRAWFDPEEMVEQLNLNGTLWGEPLMNTRGKALKALRKGDTSLFMTKFDRRTVPQVRKKMVFGLFPDSIEPDISKAVVDDSGTQRLRQSETKFLRDMWLTGRDEDREEIKRLLKTYLFRKDLDDLVKKADAARNRMVRANRISKGLEPAAPKPVTDSTGRAYQPGMKVVGHGGNRAFFTPAEMSRVNADRSQFIQEHPGQFAAAMAAPWLAAGAGVAGATAPVWGPKAALAARIGVRGLAEAGKLWWTGGDSWVASSDPVLHNAGLALRTVTRAAPLYGWYARNKPKADAYVTEQTARLKSMKEEAKNLFTPVQKAYRAARKRMSGLN